jgi:hypothetical protein
MAEKGLNLNEELQKSFVEQFSINQNNHQSLFTKVLSLLLTVIIGFGYVYTNGGKLEKLLQTQNEFLLVSSFMVATTIVFFGVVLVTNLALGYRRDQFVVDRIRRSSGLLCPGSNKSIFPESYSPIVSLEQKKEIYDNFKRATRFVTRLKRYTIIVYLWRYIDYRTNWMPNYHSIHFMVLSFLNFLLVAILTLNPHDNMSFDWNAEIHWWYLGAISYWLLLLIYSFRRVIDYHDRLLRLIKDEKYYSNGGEN